MDKKSNKALWFLLVIVIPLLFAASLSVIIFSLMGVNLIDKGKNYAASVPVLSNWVDAEETGGTDDDLIRSLESQIHTLEKKVEEADRAVLQKDDQIKEHQSDIAMLKDQLQKRQDEDSQSDEAATSNITEVYTTMSPGNAAKILEAMDQNEAVMIIAGLDSETQANVLSEMSPELAAEMTNLLTN